MCLQLWGRPPRLPEIYISPVRFREDELSELGEKKKKKGKTISRLIFFIEILTELNGLLKPRGKPRLWAILTYIRISLG